jgi:hypothetical protein
MREIRQMLHSRSLQRLEVVVPSDLSVGILNNRRKELAGLEDRTDCRIIFNPDALMKAREFRLNPTFRKGERRRDEKHQPVRPSLLAPLMVEQAKAIKLAKELAAMKADDLERELNSDPVAGEARDSAAAKEAIEPAPRPVEVVVAPVVRKAAEIWEEAAVLRRLLFSISQPMLVVPTLSAPAVQSVLATPSVQATNPPRNNHGGRRRQRRR